MLKKGTTSSPAHDLKMEIPSDNKSELSHTSQLWGGDCYLDVWPCCISSEGQQPGFIDDVSRSMKLVNQETVPNNRLPNVRDLKQLNLMQNLYQSILSKEQAGAEAYAQEEHNGRSNRETKQF